VGILVETVLKPENLVPKRINGELVTLEELVHLIRNYEKCFRDEQIPSLQSLFLVILILKNIYSRTVEIVVVVSSLFC
jgi:hypothetical protein